MIIKSFWGQKVLVLGKKLWQTNIQVATFRKFYILGLKPCVGLNEKLISEAVRLDVKLKIQIIDRDIYFYVPAWEYKMKAERELFPSKFGEENDYFMYYYPVPKQSKVKRLGFKDRIESEKEKDKKRQTTIFEV